MAESAAHRSGNEPAPWYLQDLAEAQQIADKTDEEAEAAADDAYALEHDLDAHPTAKAKQEADEAGRRAREEEANAKIAEEEALERSMWAVQMGERDAADKILEKDPGLIETDSKFFKQWDTGGEE